MIVVGAYPRSFESNAAPISPIRDVAEFLSPLLPSGVGVHLLPFFPSAGDWGFAPNDWMSVDPDLGTWGDVGLLASHQPLIVDGIYTHVGFEHSLIRGFFEHPGTDRYPVAAYPGSTLLESARSPRGGPVLRRHTVAGEVWQLWQTFTDSAVDIDLDDLTVREAVAAQLDLFAQHRVWGVRLDAPAYYSKQLGPLHRHHPDSYRLAGELAALVKSRGFAVLAQLDADSFGLQYFQDLDFEVPIVDYAYSAHLALALLTRDPSAFADHLVATWRLPRTVLRAPRTHDGILLRSALLPTTAFDAVVAAAREHRIPVRIIDDRPYELNCSLPYICSLQADEAELHRRIALVTAVSALIPGWCYLYLPLLLAHIPEHHGDGTHADPRSLNRLPMPETARRAFNGTSAGHALTEFLARLVELRRRVTEKSLPGDSVTVSSPGLLIIDRPTAGLCLVANFASRSVSIASRRITGRLAFGCGADDRLIAPSGFGVWRAPI